MEKIYYDPKNSASLGGVQNLKKAVGKNPLQWLQSQRAYTLHKPARRNFPMRRTRTSHSGAQWQADLNDMIAYSRENKGYCYILTVVDVFSRYAWAQPLKSKTAKDVTSAFEKIFKMSAAPPQYLQTDRGKEFENAIFDKYLRKHGVHWFAVTSATKASLCERFNRTLKTRMFRYFTHRGANEWVEVLQDLVKSYNESTHRSLPKGMSPKMAAQPQNHESVWRHQENEVAKKSNKNGPTIGDEVRISKYKGSFHKGYLANWSEEVFTIVEVDRRFTPPMYVIKDDKGEKIVGKFYGFELQKVTNPSGLYAIEKVIRKRGDQYLVKFLGYPDSYWVKDLQKVYKQ